MFAQTIIIFSIILGIMAPSGLDLNLRYEIASNMEQNKSSFLLYPIRINKHNIAPVITSKSAIAVDKKSKKVLWSKNADKRLPIASISKLMSVLVFLDLNKDLDEIFKIEKEDTVREGVYKIREGDRVYIRDLLHSALIASDNNAANALIRASGVSRENFIEKMNKKAKELGMINTRFVEPTGLSYANISTAQDLVILLEEALSDDTVSNILKLKRYTINTLNGNVYYISNTNKLLWSYIDIVGGKTGFINESKYNLAVATKNNDDIIYIIILGSKSIDDRFKDAKSVYDWVVSNYKW